VKFGQKEPSFGRSLAQTKFVNEFQQRHVLRNPKEKKMNQHENPIIEQMLQYIDNLMSLVDREIEKLDTDERRAFIFLFFQSSGIVELIAREQSVEIWEIADELDELINDAVGSGRNYVPAALSCLSHRAAWGADDRWHKFATSLATVFLLEEKSIFKFLNDIIQTIKMASEYDRFRDLSAAHVVTATEFALDVLRLTGVEQSICHYKSQTSVTGRLN